jgi:hypothetical protein
MSERMTSAEYRLEWSAVDMMPQSESVQERADKFARQNDCTPLVLLGYGMDGSVYRTSRQSAVKILKWEILYERERDAYIRLQQNNVERICECNVPSLLSYDDEIWAVEMSVVSPPYILDFAGAYLDESPEYPPEILEEWMVEKMEQFGDGWPTIRRIVYALERMGIYLTDVNPKNIRLRA